MTTCLADGNASVKTYEALRSHVLTGSVGHHAGLVVLLREGMAAWVAQMKADPSQALPLAPKVTHSASTEFDTNLVQLLANMALAKQPQVHA